MSEYISVFSDWNAWFNSAKVDWDNYVINIKSEIESYKKQGNATPEKINLGECRLLFALRRAQTCDYEFAYNLCHKILTTNQLNIEAINFFIELLYKKNKISEAIKYSEIYKQYISKRVLIELYAKTGNLQGVIDTIYTSQERERERESLIDIFFNTIEGDTTLAEDFSRRVWLSKKSAKEILPIIKWLNIYGLYGFADMLSTEAIYSVEAPEVPEFKLERSLAFTPYLEFGTHKPLLIVFSPFMSSIVDKHYEKYGISNLEQLHGTLKFPSLHFFRGSRQFNILHVLDEYQVWGLLNLSKYFMNIRRTIETLKPSKIITFGASAGGFQSLLYGTLLNVDMAIACSPQTIAFHSYVNQYRAEMNNRYAFSLLNYCYLPKIIKNYRTKTLKVIFFSSGNLNDTWHYNLIKDIDDKTSCTTFDAGNAHSLFDVYGNKFMHDQIINKINKIL